MFYDNRYDEQDARRYDDSIEIAMARRDALESQEVIIEIEASLEAESEIERSRRRAPITERKCCLDPGSFTLVQSLDRDMDTGTFTGDFYRCGTCGTRICEEDYSAIVGYENSKIALVVLPKSPNYGAVAVELARLQARRIEEMPETRLFSRPKKGAA